MTDSLWWTAKEQQEGYWMIALVARGGTAPPKSGAHPAKYYLVILLISRQGLLNCLIEALEPLHKVTVKISCSKVNQLQIDTKQMEN